MTLPKLPESMTTVTKLSKTLALILFIALPFLGFYLGSEYQKNASPKTTIELKPIEDVIVTPTPTPTPSATLTPTATVIPTSSVVPTVVTDSNGQSTYQSNTVGIKIKFPSKTFKLYDGHDTEFSTGTTIQKGTNEFYLLSYNFDDAKYSETKVSFLNIRDVNMNSADYKEYLDFLGVSSQNDPIVNKVTIKGKVYNVKTFVIADGHTLNGCTYASGEKRFLFEIDSKITAVITQPSSIIDCDDNSRDVSKSALESDQRAALKILESIEFI